MHTRTHIKMHAHSYVSHTYAYTQQIVRSEKIPENLKEAVEEKRMELIEKLSDADEEIAEMYLMEEEPDKETLHKAIRRSVIGNKFIPVFMGSAFKNKGKVGVWLSKQKTTSLLILPFKVAPVRHGCVCIPSIFYHRCSKIAKWRRGLPPFPRRGPEYRIGP